MFNKKVRLWRAVGDNNNVNMNEIDELAKKNIEQVESASRAESRLPELVATFTNLVMYPKLCHTYNNAILIIVRGASGSS